MSMFLCISIYIDIYIYMCSRITTTCMHTYTDHTTYVYANFSTCLHAHTKAQLCRVHRKISWVRTTFRTYLRALHCRSCARQTWSMRGFLYAVTIATCIQLDAVEGTGLIETPRGPLRVAGPKAFARRSQSPSSHEGVLIVYSGAFGLSFPSRWLLSEMGLVYCRSEVQRLFPDQTKGRTNQHVQPGMLRLRPLWGPFWEVPSALILWHVLPKLRIWEPMQYTLGMQQSS